MAEQKIEYQLELDVRNWSRGIDMAISDLRSFEQSLARSAKEIDSFESKMNQAFKSMPKMEDIDITVDAKLGTIESGIENLLSDDHADITVDAKEGTIPSSINELLSDPASTINVDAKEGSVDSGIDELLADPSVNMSVDIKEGSMDSTIQMLLGGAAAVELAVNLKGAAGGVLGALGFPIDPLIEADTAMARFEAVTGQRVEGLAEKIENVYTGAWGESRDEVARVMAKLVSDLEVPEDQLESLTGQVFDVANIMDADFNEVLSAAAAMVDSEFAPSLEDAFDGMVKGQQEGLNRSGDLLDTFREYSSTFSDMGFTMDDSLTTMNAGLEAGIDNTDRIADAIREAGIRATTDFDTKKDFFQQIGLLEEAQAFADGEITGKEYMDGLFAALADVEDTSVRELIQDELLGTISEDFGADALSALGDITEQITLIGDEAEKSGDRINDTMGTAWTTIKRTFQSEVADYFNNELDFTGFMQRLKDGVSGFFSDLKSGEGFGESLSINLSSVLDNTAFGEAIGVLIDALLATAESIVTAVGIMAMAIDKLTPASIDTDPILGTLTDIRNFRFNLDLGNLEEMGRDDFANFLNDAAKRSNFSTELLPNLIDGFEGALNESMSGVDAGVLLGNLKFTQGQVSDDLKPTLDPLIQDALQQTTDAMNEAINSGDFGGAIDIATLLVGAGELPASQIESLRLMAQTQFDQIMEGGITASEVGDAASVYEGFISTLNDPAAISAAKTEMGTALTGIFDSSLAAGNFELSQDIADILVGSLGEDEAFWQNTIKTAEMEAEAQAITEAANTTGDDLTKMADEVGLGFQDSGKWTEEYGETSDRAFNAAKNAFSTYTSQLLADGLLIETALAGIGEAFNLLPAVLQGGGFVMPGVPVNGGGVTNNTTVNQTNTFNNQNGAASAGSGQTVANAINQPI